MTRKRPFTHVRAFTVQAGLLLCFCVVLSTLSYRAQWHVWPPFDTVFMTWTVLAPFALPEAFTDVVGMSSSNRLAPVWMYVTYWLGIGALSIGSLKNRRVWHLASLAAIMVLSSIYALTVGNGMIGI